MWVEQPCVGVPGLVNFVSARSRWLDLQVNAACRTEAVTQAVVLRSGLDSRACRLRIPGLQFYEVDDREALAQKRALLDAGKRAAGGGGRRRAAGGGVAMQGRERLILCWQLFAESLLLPGCSCLLAVLPDRSKHPRPRFVAVSWDNIKSLIPALTAEGFDPMQRSIFIMEGTLPHLTPVGGRLGGAGARQATPAPESLGTPRHCSVVLSSAAPTPLVACRPRWTPCWRMWRRWRRPAPASASTFCTRCGGQRGGAFGSMGGWPDGIP